MRDLKQNVNKVPHLSVEYDFETIDGVSEADFKLADLTLIILPEYVKDLQNKFVSIIMDSLQHVDLSQNMLLLSGSLLSLYPEVKE